jgi:hypothetical protein
LSAAPQICGREPGLEADAVPRSLEAAGGFFLVLDGELYVVPRGVEHQTYDEREASLLLIEPTGTPNTGDPKTAAPRQEL